MTAASWPARSPPSRSTVSHLGRAWPARSPPCPRLPRADRLRPGRGAPVPALPRRPAPAGRRAARDVACRARRPGGIHPGRIDVIGGGALVVEALAGSCARGGITVVVSEHDILDGIARSMTWTRPDRRRSSTPPCPATGPARGWSPGANGAREKRAAFRDEEYWGRPVPGFGPPTPAADRRPGPGRARRQPDRPDVHRRPFRRRACSPRCTRRSGQPADGRQPRRRPDLRGTRITAPVHCAPPDNKPTPTERDTCGGLAARRAGLLADVRAVVVSARSAGRRCSRCWPAPAGRCPARARGSATARRWSWRGERAAAPVRQLPRQPAEHVHRPAHPGDAGGRAAGGGSLPPVSNSASFGLSTN